MQLNFKNELESATIKIYDTIEGDGWGFGTKDIEDQLKEANGKPLNIYINSYGGEVFEGFAIYNIIKRYTGQKTVYIDGIAASIASVIALAGDKLIMNKASMFMIHNASGCCIGNAEDMKKVIQALESINEVIKGVYKDKSNLTEEQITEMMNKETFLTAQECLEYGLCDEVLDKEQDNESYKNTLKSMELLKDSIDERIKMLNSLKEVPEVGDKDIVNHEDTFFNKQNHWNWLNGKEIF